MKKCQSNDIFIPPRMDFPYDALDKTIIKRLMSPQNITYNLTSHMLIPINRSTIPYRNETTRFVMNVPFQDHKNRFFVQTSISKWWFLITKTLKQFGGHEPRKPWTKLQFFFWQNWFKCFFSWSRQGMSWLGVSLFTFFSRWASNKRNITGRFWFDVTLTGTLRNRYQKLMVEHVSPTSTMDMLGYVTFQ